jgi:glycerophosphoryl diester phosphodiesterase
MLRSDRSLPPLYAHRLGRAYGPDSSGAALIGALTAGVEGLETDVCLTADGELVLLHDPYLPLGTGLEGFAHERTARELRQTRLRDRDGRLTTEAPLFLDDLLGTAPADVVLQIEVKAHADLALAGRTVDALARRLRDRARERRFEVLSFEAATCARAARLGCPARLVVWADYAPAALTRWARRHGVGGVCVEHFLLSPALMARLRRGGLSVSTGTLNERVLLDRVLPLRPDAVTSDRPHALRVAPTSAPMLAA